MTELRNRPQAGNWHRANGFTRQRGNINAMLALAGLALITGAILWGFFAGDSEPEPKPAPVVTEPAPEPETDTGYVPAPVPAAPDQEPIAPAEVEPEPEPELSLPEPPALTRETSDPALREAAAALGGGPALDQFVAGPYILDRSVGLIDSIALGDTPYKLLPVARPSTPFRVRETGVGTLTDPANHARYDGLAGAIDGIDPAAVAAAYGRFAGLADEAYELLGNGPGQFEAAVYRALDMISTTPDVPADARLVRHEAVWKYEDPALEALPALQKQILRMGPDNADTLRAKARAIRDTLQN